MVVRVCRGRPTQSWSGYRCTRRRWQQRRPSIRATVDNNTVTSKAYAVGRGHGAQAVPHALRRVKGLLKRSVHVTILIVFHPVRTVALSRAAAEAIFRTARCRSPTTGQVQMQNQPGVDLCRSRKRAPLIDLTNTENDHSRRRQTQQRSQGWYAQISSEKKTEYLQRRRIARQQKKAASVQSSATLVQSLHRTPSSNLTNTQTQAASNGGSSNPHSGQV